MRSADVSALAQHMQWADATIWSTIFQSSAADDAKLAETLHHVHLVQHLFRQAWAGDPFQMRDRVDFSDTHEIARWGRQAHDEIASFLSGAGAADFDRELRVPWAGHFEKHTSRTAAAHTVGESILQVAMHTSHHRGQLCTQLRQLGVEPPNIEFIMWLWLARPEADWTVLERSDR